MSRVLAQDGNGIFIPNRQGEAFLAFQRRNAGFMTIGENSMKNNRLSVYPSIALVLALVSGVSHAGNCPGNLKKVNPGTVNASVNCLNKENAARTSETAALQTQIDSLKAQVGDASSFQAAIEQLQKDVRALQGLTPVAPIGVFENDFLKANALGVTKILSGQDGRAYVSATFQIQNKSASTLYLAYDLNKRFTVVDDHGISAVGSDYGREISGLNAVNSEYDQQSRSNFSVVSPGSVVSIGFETGWIDKEAAAKLGSRFNLTFTVMRYLEPQLAQSNKTDSVTLGFANIVATQ